MNDADSNPFRVKLVNSTLPSEKVEFLTTPDLIETRNVNYKTVDPVHAPGQMMAYQNTSSRSFNISQIRLVSRNEEEAHMNLYILWTLRGWTMPVFGQSTLTDIDVASRKQAEQMKKRGNMTPDQMVIQDTLSRSGTELRGAPPAVLLLSAYSNDSNQNNSAYGKHISRVPVVIQNLSIPYPSDVDYIPAAYSGIPMPTIMTIDITLTETQSPGAYTNFNLMNYKTGTLKGF